MTKKIIALVLFVAMLVALVPVASATPAWTKNNQGYYTRTQAEVIYGTTDPIWYAKAVSEALTASGNVIGTYGSGTGVKVEITEGAAKTTVKISGDYSTLQPYYYDYTGNTSAYGKAVKIPFKVTTAPVKTEYDPDTGALATYRENRRVEVTTDSYLNGGTTYYAAYTVGNDRIYYLNFLLQEGGNKGSYYIKYQNLDSYEIAVEFVDTDRIDVNNAYAAKLEVVGLAGLHTDNFRAEYENGEYVEPKKANNYKGYYENGTLTFYIAAMTKEDREKIWSTGITEKTGSLSGAQISDETWNAILDELEDGWYIDFSHTIYYKYFIADPTRDEMVVRLKAYDRNGVVYAPGTVVLVKNEGKWTDFGANYAEYNEEMLGYSEKFVNVDGKATYLVDRDGCIAFKMTGIGRFAHDAKGKFDTDVAFYRKTVSEDITLQFVKTTNGEETNVTFDLVFQNIDRTTSGITLLAEEMEVVVGDTVQIPYIVDNPYALSTALKSVWVSTNDKVISVTDEDEGYIKAKAVGKAYVYCTDAAGKVKLVIVNAVAQKTEDVPEVVVPDTVKYVVTASRLNFREGPGTSYKSLGLIDRNTVVEGIETTTNGWVKVSYNGKEGYCSGKYLAEIN